METEVGGRWGEEAEKEDLFFGSFSARPRKTISACQVFLAKIIIQFVHPSSKEEYNSFEQRQPCRNKDNHSDEDLFARCL